MWCWLGIQIWQQRLTRMRWQDGATQDKLSQLPVAVLSQGCHCLGLSCTCSITCFSQMYGRRLFNFQIQKQALQFSQWTSGQSMLLIGSGFQLTLCSMTVDMTLHAMIEHHPWHSKAAVMSKHVVRACAYGCVLLSVLPQGGHEDVGLPVSRGSTMHWRKAL